MKMMATPLVPALPEVIAPPILGQARARLSSFIALTKPRITLMVLITVATGFLLGGRKSSHPLTFTWTLLGTGLVAAGASVWNQRIERDRDSLMRRTANRPIPTGRVSLREAELFGTVLGLGGTKVERQRQVARLTRREIDRFRRDSRAMTRRTEA